jgi:hypothetical protein
MYFCIFVYRLVSPFWCSGTSFVPRCFIGLRILYMMYFYVYVNILTELLTDIIYIYIYIYIYI